MVLSVVLTIAALDVLPSGAQALVYEPEIYADGSSAFYLGTHTDYTTGRSESVIKSPLEFGETVTVGEGVPGYGKRDGDQIYRFSDKIPGGWYTFLGWSHGSPADGRDQTGEISYRLGTNQALMVGTNRWDANGESHDIHISRTDAYWHKLSYAYNSAAHVTAIWVDGVFYTTLNKASAGLWLMSTAAIPDGECIELDDLRVWTLKPESSGQTLVGADGKVIYESYGRLVADTLDITPPTLHLTDENMRIAGNVFAVAADFTAGDITGLGADGSVAVYAPDFSIAVDKSAPIADGMLVFVQKEQRFAIYTVEKFQKEKRIWRKGLCKENGQYKMKLLNPSANEMTVIGITENQATACVTEWNRVSLAPGECKEIGFGYTQTNDMCFYLWNSGVQPLCGVQYDKIPREVFLDDYTNAAVGTLPEGYSLYNGDCGTVRVAAYDVKLDDGSVVRKNCLEVDDAYPDTLGAHMWAGPGFYREFEPVEGKLAIEARMMFLQETTPSFSHCFYTRAGEVNITRWVGMHTGMVTWSSTVGFEEELPQFVPGVWYTYRTVIDLDANQAQIRVTAPEIGLDKTYTELGLYGKSAWSAECVDTVFYNTETGDGKMVFDYIKVERAAEDLPGAMEFVHPEEKIEPEWIKAPTPHAVPGRLNLSLNGEYLYPATPMYGEGGAVMIYAKNFAQLLGGSYLPGKCIEIGGRVLEFTDNPAMVRLDGTEKQMQPPAAQKDGKLFIPLRFAAALGYDVDWDKETETVRLQAEGK